MATANLLSPVIEQNIQNRTEKNISVCPRKHIGSDICYIEIDKDTLHTTGPITIVQSDHTVN